MNYADLAELVNLPFSGKVNERCNSLFLCYYIHAMQHFVLFICQFGKCKKIEKNGSGGGGVHLQIKLHVIIMLKEHGGKRVDKTQKTRARWPHSNQYDISPCFTIGLINKGLIHSVVTPCTYRSLQTTFLKC